METATTLDPGSLEQINKAANALAGQTVTLAVQVQPALWRAFVCALEGTSGMRPWPATRSTAVRSQEAGRCLRSRGAVKATTARP